MTVATPELTDRDLRELMALLKGADSVELKLTIPLHHQRSAVDALDLDPLDAQVRVIYFFDTPELMLQDSGVVVRARRIQGKGDDSVVKLRPVVPDQLPPGLRKSPSCVVEVDAMPGGYVCSASLKGTPRPPGVRETIASGRPLRKLFSKEQRAFFAEHAPEGVTIDDLTLLGPLFVLKLKSTPQGLGRKLATELWLYPDGSRILELSTRCPIGETFQVAAEARAFLSERGVDLTSEQQTKTRTALEFFAKR
jgi:hypothetical protein